MNKINTSPILGYININPLKKYSFKEFYSSMDDIIGKFFIKTNREANIFLFYTKQDEITGLYESYNLFYSNKIRNNSLEINVFRKANMPFTMVAEYSQVFNEEGTEEIPFEFDVSFKKLGNQDLYNTDFVTFATKSGIPYPANNIGIYSRYEFEIPATNARQYYQREGTLYENNQRINDTSLPTLIKKITTFTKTLLGGDYRKNAIDVNKIISTGSTQEQQIKNNSEIITEFILKNKIIIKAEQAFGIISGESVYKDILEKIVSEKDFNTLIQLSEDLVNESYSHNTTLAKIAESIQDLVESKTSYKKHLESFMDIIFKTEDEDNYGDTIKAINLGIIESNQSIGTTKADSGYITTKFLLTSKMSDPISGRLDLKGESSFTGMHASSKILIGHYNENERGYLKRVVATDKYGKTHKDAFIKNQYLANKEEDYIYLDLLQSSKNIFANSGKILSSVALLERKFEEEKPKADIIIHFVDVDTKESILPDVIFSNVYMQDYIAEQELIIPSMNLKLLEDGSSTIDESEKYYMLTSKKDHVRLIVHKNGVNVEYTFYYTERLANFIYKFVNENGEKIKENYEVLRKPYNTYTAPDFITSTTEGALFVDSSYVYSLIGPTGEIYQVAEKKGDIFETEFKYKLTTSNFTFKLIDSDTKALIDVSNDDYIASLPEPMNINPIIFKDKTKVTYRAPEYISMENFKYKVYGVFNFIDLPSSISQPEITREINYKVVKSKFRFNFILDGTVIKLIESVKVDKPDISAEYVAKNIIHTENMADDEYYILKDESTAKQKLIADDLYEVVEYDYKYIRLTGDITIRYKTDEDDFIDVDNYKTVTYENVSSLEVEAPLEIVDGTNIKYNLIEDETPRTKRLIVTPNETNIIYDFMYKVTRIKPVMNFNFNSTCEFRFGCKFLLLNESDTIIGKFSLDDLNYSFEYFGLSFNFSKKVYDISNPDKPPVLMPDNFELNENNDTVITASKYRVELTGGFTFDNKQLSGNKIKLVGFNNINNVHGHQMFTLRYGNSSDTKYGYVTDKDFKLFQTDFSNSLFDIGNVLDTTKTSEFLSIDLSKKNEEEVYVINENIVKKPNTKTLNIG